MAKVILVVDDEPMLRAFVREVLEPNGYAVREASSAHDAILLLDQGGIDILLTDIEMPGILNGLDLAWMARAMWPAIPVILTSGRVLPRAAEVPTHVPMLTKPFSAERLLAIVRAH
jgi:CheY-like chemotaxis protein